MRILALAIFVIGTVSIGPAAAQTYDPAYPVCLHVYERMGAHYYNCSYTLLPQCNASASGRSATCVINPYYAGAGGPRGSSTASPRLLKNECIGRAGVG
jgi:hypothetical protein